MDEKIQCVGSDLCQELAGSHDTSFSLTYEGDPPSRYIYGTGRLRVIADFSPLAVGHLLLLPIDHYISFGQLIGDGGAHELCDLLRLVMPAYEGSFGSPTILEHGSSSDMNNAACIMHAHWHIVPVDGNEVNRIVKRDGLAPEELAGFEQLQRFAENDRSYYYCFSGGRHIAYLSHNRLSRQYLRSVVGEILGIPDPLWDYALVVRKHLLRRTMLTAKEWNLAEHA